MTDQEINIALAEVRGWKRTSNSGSGWQAPDGCPDCYPPNYCHDLNAMHEVEKTLEGTLNWCRYGIEIAKITRCVGPRNGAIRLNGFGYYAIAHATARQRAEAFLRTLGKWSDSSDDKNALAAAKCL